MLVLGPIDFRTTSIDLLPRCAPPSAQPFHAIREAPRAREHKKERNSEGRAASGSIVIPRTNINNGQTPWSPAVNGTMPLESLTCIPVVPESKRSIILTSR